MFYKSYYLKKIFHTCNFLSALLLIGKSLQQAAADVDGLFELLENSKNKKKNKILKLK